MGSRIPLTFEKGVLESVESSMVPLGFATKLENWEPEPSGNLVCRTGWVSAGTSGAPATRRARGIGRFQSVAAFQTPSLVQSAKTSATGGSVSRAWPAATTSGSLLLAIVSFNNGSSGFTAPSGWALAASQANGTSAETRIYYKAGAASESGAVTFSKSVSATYTLHLLEYRGVAASTPIDQTASAAGTSTTPSTGTTPATTQANELWIGAIGVGNSVLPTSPTNGFAIVDSQTGAGGGSFASAILSKNVSATGTASSSATLASSQAWVGVMVTFKAAAASSASATTGFLLVAQQETTGHGIYQISGSSLASGPWSLIETVANAGASWPVSFATGLQVVLYTSPYFTTLRRYDSTAAAAVAGSPPGRVVVFHKNRFFVGGTIEHPSRLWYSQLADYSLWWKADKGETSLADSTNYIDIDKDDGDAIEDIVPFEDGLLIAKEGSIHFLTGTGPDTFSRQRFNTGAGFAGRCICSTPYGAVIAAKNHIGLWGGGGVDVLSKPIETSYAITGDFVSTAYLDGVARILDEGTGTAFCLNMNTGAWYVEKVDNSNEAPAVIWAHDNKLFMGPQAATSGSLLSYRQIGLAGSRKRDHGTLSETFRAWTGEVWPEGPSDVVTPLYLYVRYRQRGAGGAGVTVTPYYRDPNGILQTGTAGSLAAQASAGVYQETVIVANDSVGKGVRGFQVKFEHTVPSGGESLIDIEECILEYDVDRAQ